MSRSEGPTARAQPFYCPYCGEEDFIPFGEERGAYLCNSCARHYTVRFIGLVATLSPEGQ
jgi:transposase-like protein